MLPQSVLIEMPFVSMVSLVVKLLLGVLVRMNIQLHLQRPTPPQLPLYGNILAPRTAGLADWRSARDSAQGLRPHGRAEARAALDWPRLFGDDACVEFAECV